MTAEASRPCDKMTHVSWSRALIASKLMLIRSFVFLLAFTAAAHAAEIAGQVRDPQGAAVLGARVRVFAGARTVAGATTGDDGRYSATVDEGTYSLTATAPRMEGTVNDVRVPAAGTTSADIIVQIPAFEQTISVVADTAQVAIEQSPGNSSLVGTEEIRDSLAINLKDVLGFTPGVLIQPRYGSEESRFSIRGSGIRSNYHLRGVNLFLNGISYQDGDGFTEFEAVELHSMRQIEVWKGANALRYGGNSAGGGVNLVTYTGETASPFQATVETGSYGLFKAHVSTGGVKGPLSYYLSAADTEYDGYREHSEQGRQRFFGNLGWNFSPRTTARVDLIYSNAAERYPNALTAEGFAAKSFDTIPEYVDNNWGRYQNLVRVALDLRHVINDNQEIEMIGFAQYRTLWHPIFQILDQDTRTFGGEFRYRANGRLFGRRDRFVAGFMPQLGTQEQRNLANLGGDGGDVLSFHGARSENLGFYFDNQLDLRDNLTLSVGGRFDSALRRYTDFFTSDGDRSGERRFTVFSPKVGVSWQASNMVQVFGNFSRSYEPPVMLELISFGGDTMLPLNAQDTWQAEIGMRGRVGSRTTWDAAFFNMAIDNELLNINVQPFPGAPFTIPSYRNTPNSRHTGMEFALGTILKSGTFASQDTLFFRSSYTYANFRYQDDPVYGDNVLPGQPRHAVRGELRYESGNGFFVAPNVDWSPAFYFVNSPNTAQNGNWAVVNLRAGYDWSQFGIFIEAQNLTDRYYSGSVIVDDAAGRFYEPGVPRSLYGGIRVRL